MVVVVDVDVDIDVDGSERGELDWDQPAGFLHLLGLLDRGIQRELQPLLLVHGLSVAEYTCLTALRAEPGLSNAELARRSLVTPQSMNEVITKLEQRGLVERHRDRGHGRILRTEVTVAGSAVLDRAVPEVAALEGDLLDGVSTDRVTRARQGLIEMIDRLREVQDRRS